MTRVTRAHSTQGKNDDNWIVRLLVGSAILVMGLYFAVHQVPAIITGLQSQTWSATTATVLSSRWLTHLATGDEYNQEYEGKGYTHTPEITYSYTVQGRKFTGARYQFGDTGRRYVNDIKSVVDRYPVGRVVRVTYNPNDPSQSVLEPGVNGMSWFMLAVGLAMIALGMYFGFDTKWKLFTPNP
jgi:hypothetical protein